jgi:quercetin dioxygenase-like cupin family protein
MKSIFTALISLAAVSSAPAFAENAIIFQGGSRSSVQAPTQNFTGSVIIDPLFPSNAFTPAVGGHVTFAPGARSDWHTHPAGQHLIITDGTGWIQEEGGLKREVRPGDVIWTPPGVKHWHGATDKTGMRHIAITNVVNGRNADWMEKVTDDQYAK